MLHQEACPSVLARSRTEERVGALEAGRRVVEALEGDAQVEAARRLLNQVEKVIDASLDRELATEVVVVTLDRIERTANRMARDRHLLEIVEVNPTDDRGHPT